MIKNSYEKVKSWAAANKFDLFIAAVIFLVGLGSFGLGRLSVIWPKKQPIRITNNQLPVKEENGVGNRNTQSAAITSAVKGKYIASKSGTSYHFPWCPGALRIKESNKIWFQSKEEAEGRGYKPASNCPGL